MVLVNVWDSGLASNFTYYNTIDELVAGVSPADFGSFLVKNSYSPDQEPEFFMESFAREKGIELVFCDQSHPIAVCNLIGTSVIISNEFFNTHKDEFINRLVELKKEQINSNSSFITLDSYTFSEELLDLALKNCDNITLDNIELTDEQLKKIRKSFKEVILKKDGNSKKISSMYTFGNNTIKDLTSKSIIIIDPLDDSFMDNLKCLDFINDNATVNIKSIKITDENYSQDIEKYFKNILEFLKVKNKLNKKFQLKVKVYDGHIFEKYLSDFMAYKDDNVSYDIDLQNYSIEEYSRQIDILEGMVSDIKQSQMSPFEKYLAVYNIVKKYKEYKENEIDKSQSRYLKYILYNDYMVCVGYSKMLVELLYRVGISGYEYSTSVYDRGFDEYTFLGAHARSVVNIKDEKYGIDGFYMADATWDNNYLVEDTYNHAIRTMDDMQQSQVHVFSLASEDYFLDVHSFDEYVEKINAFLNKKIENILNFILKILIDVY